jgi:hypothetical protein
VTELPKFHDELLDGLRILAGGVVEFYLRNVSGETFTLELRGVTRMGIWEVREGNIIFDLIVRDVASATAEDVATLGLAGPDGPDTDTVAWLRGSKSKQLEINSSYGANGLVVFESYKLHATGERSSGSTIPSA